MFIYLTVVGSFYRHGAEVVPGEDIAGPSVRQPPFKGAGEIELLNNTILKIKISQKQLV